MKKTVTVLLCSLLLVSLFSCETAENIDDITTTPEETETEDLEKADEAVALQYEAALKGEITVIDRDMGEVKLSECIFPGEKVRLGDCDILYKAILDMDGDGENEYVIRSEDNEHIVLHLYNEKVYSYSFDAKSFFNLSNNGFFYWTDSYDPNNCTRGCNRITFDGETLSVKEMYRIKQTSPYDYGDGDHEYFVDGKQISREEFKEYYRSNCIGGNIKPFSPIDIFCQYTISAEKACELASDYWGIKDGMGDGAAGTCYLTRIVVLEKPDGYTQSYRIGWKAEGYTTHVIDYLYGQPPTKEGRIYEELIVDAVTGECRKELSTAEKKAETAYYAFLKNEKCTEGGEYLKNFREEYLAKRLWQYGESLGYAFVDMNGDGQKDLVVRAIDTLIFSYSHESDSIRFLGTYNFRDMDRIYEDGSYSWTWGGSAPTYGIAKGISSDSYIGIWTVRNDGGEDAEFYIGDQRVTEEELLAYTNENPSPAEVKFSHIRGEGWNKVISADRAVEIASEYWGINDGDMNGQTGEPYRIYVSPETNEIYYVRLHSGTYDAPDIAYLYVDAVTGEVLSESERIMMVYESVIRGDILVYRENSKGALLKDIAFPNGDTVGEYELLEKTVLDIDRDGVEEYLIRSPQLEYIILRYYEGRVYSYGFSAESFCNPNTDGTFYWHESNMIGLRRITFDGTSVVVKDIYSLKISYDWADEYYLGGNEVTRLEYLEYYAYSRRDFAQFSPFELSSSYPVTAEQAWKIADSYWGNPDGKYDCAMGTTYYYKVTVTEMPNGNEGYYLVTFNEHIYYHHTDGWEARHSKAHCIKQVTVNARTGECKPYVEPDGKG